jgi:hypothetical protein
MALDKLPERPPELKGDAWWKSLDKNGKVEAVREPIDRYGMSNHAIQAYFGLSSSNMITNARSNLKQSKGYVPQPRGPQLNRVHRSR